jgi:hypothetical protein
LLSSNYLQMIADVDEVKATSFHWTLVMHLRP